jgi:hypothetical protein
MQMRAAEEARRAAEEAELAREEEEERRKAEERERKRAAAKAKKEQLKKEGKLLTGKAKAEAERLAALRAQLLAQAAEKGLALPGACISCVVWMLGVRRSIQDPGSTYPIQTPARILAVPILSNPLITALPSLQQYGSICQLLCSSQ